MTFEITEDKIAVIEKCSEYMTILAKFAEWAATNFHGHNAEQSYLICLDFVKSNEHIIKKIKGISDK